MTVKSSKQKALEINLDLRYYGVFAEIGAGQEVARHFFKAGAASQTIAKTISAYDMVYSDHIYGKEESGRYVCQARLEKMIDREFNQINDRLGKKKEGTCFFAFANTVAIRNFQGTNDPHGWMGIKFIHKPGANPSSVVVHVRMFDNSAEQQQDALGTVGVNCVYAAFYKHQNPKGFVSTLMENVSHARIEIDMVKVSGPAFEDIDNRLIDLELVKQGYTNAVLFDKDGKVLNVSDYFYKQNVLVVRGSYRPPTLVNIDVLKTSMETFCKVNELTDKHVKQVAEITIGQLNTEDGEIRSDDFLARVDLMSDLGFPVLISNYKQYFRLSNFFARFKCKKVGLVLGIYNFLQIFDESYSDTKGGLLESLGRLFRANTQVYVYPSNDEKGELLTLSNIEIPIGLEHLYKHFVTNDAVHEVQGYNAENLHIYSRKVVKMIMNNEEGWEKFVPESVAKTINDECLFGHPCESGKTPKKK